MKRLRLAILLFCGLSGCVTGKKEPVAKEPVKDGASKNQMDQKPTADAGISIKGHWDRITTAVFSQNGSLLVTGSADMTVRLWDVASGRELMRFSGHTQPISAVAISPSGSMIASGGHDNVIRVWNTKTGAEIRRLQGHKRFVSSLAFSEDQLKVISGSGDRTVAVWDLENGRLIRSWTAHQKAVSCVSIDSASDRIFSGSDDKTLAFWDANTGKIKWRNSGHTGGIIGCRMSPRGAKGVSLGADHKLIWWDLALGRSIGRLDTKTASLNGSVGVSADGSRYGFASENENGGYDVFFGRFGEAAGAPQVGHTGPVLAWFFDGDSVKTVSSDETIRNWTFQQPAPAPNNTK